MVTSRFGLCLAALAFSPSARAMKNKDPTLDEPFQSSFAHLPHAACVSLFHRQGRFGCSTAERETQTGGLQYFDSSIKFPSYKDPYVLVVDEHDLTNNNVQIILGNNKFGLLQGILVANRTDESSTYISPAPQSPQGENTPSENVNYGTLDYAWNSYGDGLYLEDLHGIPLAYMADSGVSDYIRDISLSSDKESSIVAEFNYYMGASTMDSPTCLSWHDSDGVWRPKCLPLGGTSVWATAGSPEEDSDSGRRLEDGGDGDDAGDDAGDDSSSASDARPVVMVTTSMDATSLYHDAVPGANTAASNILTLLMAAKLLGSIPDDTLDGLNKKILFAFFQGESYGFIGSRAFLRDVAYPGFQCAENMTVSSVAKPKSGATSENACLYPLRPSLEFQNIGEITGMITVDQVGILSTQNTLYAHNDGSDFGGFLSNLFLLSSSGDVSVSAADSQDGAYPPTPLTSLLQLSEGGVGGAILSGYNSAYAPSGYYHSHKDSIYTRKMSLDAIASAATVMAQAALAAAYDDGSYDSNTASQYAQGLISDLSSSDETLVSLANCLYEDGSCDLLKAYGKVEQHNDHYKTGIDLGPGNGLGTPPNYYVSVYDVSYGQPFVQVDEVWYGAYDGEDYGKKNGDTFAMRPTLLEQAIRGMLNDFLGRGSTVENSDGTSSSPTLKSCSKSKDCSGVSYCNKNGDSAVCTGGKVCVCSRSHYHIALDEALEAPANNATGAFVISENDYGVSAMYTEPYWSNSVGVRVYRDVGNTSGMYALGAGIFLLGTCGVTVLLLKSKMKKQKLY